MIKATDLIARFEQAVTDKWGYIWGTAGVLWTKAKQQQKIDYMVNKYGTNWKINSEAKSDNYYYSAVYGDKWIGHYVADCSGLFVWAYKQLGGAIAHGSNSIYDRYCNQKGKLTDALKKDILPGTAVFTGDSKSHGHIGLYVGNGKVVEASGTQAGVCISNISAGKWTYYGLLSAVEMDGETPTPVDADLTIRKGSKGAPVKEMQGLLKKLGYDLGPCGVDGDFGSATEKALKKFQSDHGLASDGICGPKSWAALRQADVTPVEKYTVVIPHLTKKDADALKAQFPDATINKE